MRSLTKYNSTLNKFAYYMEYAQSYREYFGAMQYLCESFGWDKLGAAFRGAQFQYDVIDERVSDDYNFMREVAHTLTIKVYENIQDYFGEDAFIKVKNIVTKYW